MRFPLWLMTLMTTAAPAADFRALLDSYCLKCHDSELRKGNLDLSDFTDEAAVMKNRAIWRSVYEKIESLQMPPPKQKEQPTVEQRRELLTWIMDIAARPDPALGAADPGKPTLRRLTRLEYNNAIRDLFGLEMDVFMFPERLPLRDKAYFLPASGKMPDDLKLDMREYGAKYSVLCPQLGLPGDNRSEHGFRNRGDVMDFSPPLLEKYLTAAREIVNSPDLPGLGKGFAALLGLDPAKVRPPSPKEPNGGNSGALMAPLVGEFAPDRDSIPEARGSSISLANFRARIATAYADGLGGVFDVPKATVNKTLSGKGGLLKATFGARAFTVNPNADIWLTGFGTAKATSAPAILTNKQKAKNSYELTFDILSRDDDEGVEHLALCAVGRKGQSGPLRLTAVLTDATEQIVTLDLAEGEAGTTFVSFSAHAGESIRKLVVDGTGIKGDYIVLDDLAVITSGEKQNPGSLIPSPLFVESPRPAAPAPDSAEKAPAPRSAHQRLSAFAERAFRRPVSTEEQDIYRSLFDQAKATGASEADAMRQAIAAMLASPAFLYIEANGTPGDSKVSPLEHHELATRLALFLWSSTPDDELLALAKARRLQDPATLEAQVRRMLKDARSRELSESFATQWLRLDQLNSAKPDRDLFKSFYSGPQGKSTLHGAALAEALLLFETVHIEDRSILDFLAADYTWLNPPLALLYDIRLDAIEHEPSSSGNANSNREFKTKSGEKFANWRRVKLPNATRGGFMTMAAPMIVTSLPFRTSPVKRGAWILETIFNRPPTEPKVAFAIENDTKDAARQMSIRQKFELHRNKAACYSCHIRLDPPGFALERFNPIGQWDAQADAKAEWTGQAFDGPAEFKTILARNPHEFTRGFIEHLMSFALGRALAVHDMPAIEKIQRAAGADGWKFSRIVIEIAKSYPFNHVRQ